MDDDTKKDEDNVAEEAAAPQEESTPAEETTPVEDALAKDEGYQFDDDLTSSDSAPVSTNSYNSGSGGGRFADELFSKTVHAKFRTFYVDLKESRNGKFVKISEKSKGRKSTIMMDAEDVPQIIEALQEVQTKL